MSSKILSSHMILEFFLTLRKLPVMVHDPHQALVSELFLSQDNCQPELSSPSFPPIFLITKEISVEVLLP